MSSRWVGVDGWVGNWGRVRVRLSGAACGRAAAELLLPQCFMLDAAAGLVRWRWRRSSPARGCAANPGASWAATLVHAGLHPSSTLQGINYLLRVGTIMVADPSADQLAVHRAQLLPDTAYVYETRHGGGLKITGQRAVANTQVRLCWGGGRAAGRCLCSSGACGGVYPRACRHPPTLPCVCNHQAA